MGKYLIIVISVFFLRAESNSFILESEEKYFLSIEKDSKIGEHRNFINSVAMDDFLVVGSHENNQNGDSDFYLYILSTDNKWRTAALKQKVHIPLAATTYAAFPFIGFLDIVGSSELDLVFVHSNGLYSLENLNGKFDENFQKILDLGELGVSTAKIADLNNQRGIVAATRTNPNSTGGEISIFFVNKGTYGRTPVKLLEYSPFERGFNPNPELNFDSIDVADVNFDGKNDILVAGTNDIFINISSSDADFEFEKAISPLTQTIGGTVAVVETDPLTIVTTDSTSYIDMPGQIKIYESPSDEKHLSETSVFSSPGPHPQNLLIVDVNFDGKNDVVSADSDTSCFLILTDLSANYDWECAPPLDGSDNGRGYYTRVLSSNSEELLLVTTGERLWVRRFSKK